MDPISEAHPSTVRITMGDNRVFALQLTLAGGHLSNTNCMNLKHAMVLSGR